MKIECPTCGKSRKHPDSEAGLLGICTACGSSYRVPDPPTAPVVDPLDGAVRSSAARQTSAAPPTRSDAILLVAATALVCLAALFFCWAGLDWHRAAEAQAASRATELKARAELLAAAGKPQEAQQSLQTLKNFLAARGPLPPELQELSEDIPRDERVIRGLMRPPVDGSTQAPSPPPAAPALPPAPRGIQPKLAVSEPSIPPDPVATSVAPQPPASRPSPPLRPPVQPVVLPGDVLTDEQIGRSITLGVDHLLKEFNAYNHLLHGGVVRDDTSIGLGILCAYALMQCQQATNDPRLNPHDELMQGLIDGIKSLKLDDYRFETYARGLRATALALYNRSEDQQALRADAAALMQGTRDGSYDYTLARRPKPPEPGQGDNSNSQYGLLGVWSAAEAGLSVPSNYWGIVQHHWTKSQDPNGQWNYYFEPSDAGTHSMTCAGIASLFVAHDYLDVPRFGAEVGRDPFTPSLLKGLAWLEDGDNCVNLDRGAYDLYGLERVGLASGFKYFGPHDWYRELAARTIASQQSDGSWGDDVETAYSLLFLARGRHPILMNKLRFDGFWANRPRDVANLARFTSHELERQMNWQVVPLSRDWTEWMDSPVLYLASHKAPNLSDVDFDKIRRFVENGGLLFMQADGDSPEFAAFAASAAHRLFPAYELIDLPADHPLLSADYKLPADPSLKVVSNGSRILMLLATTDISKSWQLREEKRAPAAFQFGTNLFVYAAGKRDLRNRLVSTYIPPIVGEPAAKYRVARLKYAGNWNPEPAAWPRFARWFQLKTGYVLDVIDVPLGELRPETAPVAHLTGTARFHASVEEIAAIRDYVEAGGVLLIDDCGGASSFFEGVKELLNTQAFPNHPPHVLSPADPVLASKGNGMEDLSKPRYRQFTMDTLGARAGGLEDISAGKGRVLYTPLDMTSGLLGTDTWGILGYERDYAQSLAKNVILWAIDRQVRETDKATNAKE